MVAFAKAYRKPLTPDRSAKDSGLRYYSPEISRWLNRDPIGERGGVNLFAFTWNAPSAYVDPVGLASDCNYTKKVISNQAYDPEYKPSDPKCKCCCADDLAAHFAGPLKGSAKKVSDYFPWVTQQGQMYWGKNDELGPFDYKDNPKGNVIGIKFQVVADWHLVLDDTLGIEDCKLRQYVRRHMEGAPNQDISSFSEDPISHGYDPNTPIGQLGVGATSDNPRYFTVDPETGAHRTLGSRMTIGDGQYGWLDPASLDKNEKSWMEFLIAFDSAVGCNCKTKTVAIRFTIKPKKVDNGGWTMAVEPGQTGGE